MKKNSSHYTVGFGRPPVEHQFKPGQSGNPSGRPKGVRNFRSDLLEELAGSVSITDGETSVMVTKQRAIVKRIVQAALGGDQRAATIVFSWSLGAFGRDSDPERETGSTESDLDDQAIAEASEERQRNRSVGNPSSKGASS